MQDLGVILPEARIREGHATGHWQDRLLLDYLDDALARSPDRAAIVADNSETGALTTLSYRDVDRLSRRFALALLDLGIGAGDVVSLLLPNWWHFNAMHLACVRVGAITNPLMPIFREAQLVFMLGFAEAKILIAPATFRGFDYGPMVAAMRPDLPALERALFIGGEGADSFEAHFMDRAWEDEDGAAARLEGLRPGPNDVTEIIYTSGTTGQPKGAMHTANTLLGFLPAYSQKMGIGENDVFFMASPMAHQTGFIWGILLPIVHGTTSVLQDRWVPGRAVELIAEHGVTFTMASTPFLNDLAEAPNVEQHDMSAFHIFLAAGAPIPPALVARAQERLGIHVLSGWGMTECALVTVCLPGDPAEKIGGTDGGLLGYGGVKVVDEAGETAPPGKEGLLKVTGPTMFTGYLKRPDLHGTDAAGWFDTGDLARMDGDGYIRISGRSKDIIIRGGENVPVVEIEASIFKHPAVEDVAIVAMPDPRLGERGCAYVTVKPGSDFSFSEMIAHLEAQGTTKHYMPERLEVLSEFPRTPSGKIQKFKLREWAAALTTAARDTPG